MLGFEGVRVLGPFQEAKVPMREVYLGVIFHG